MPRVNWVFVGLIVIAVVTGALTGTMEHVREASISSAKASVELAIGLIGQMTLWLGLVGVLRDSGALRSLARGLRPVLIRLFPDVPVDHPAMGAMMMNIAATALGLGNAATPFGLKAMRELDTLNRSKGVATNAMALFLAINTAGVAILPLTVMSVRASIGSKDPAGIIVPTLLATLISASCAVLVCKFLERRAFFAPQRYGSMELDSSLRVAADAHSLEHAESLGTLAPVSTPWRRWATAGVAAVMVVALAHHATTRLAHESLMDVLRGIFSNWLIPLLILGIVAIGFTRQVKVYESFVAGAKEGFQTVVSIIPFLVGMLVAIGMFRASGAMSLMVNALTPLAAPLGFPAEALPMVLIRPLSGSGALGLMSELMKTHGPDSFVGYLVSVLNGSTETTFYVMALYYGAVQVKVLRHSLWACLVTDVVGPLTAFVVCRLFFTSVG
jgi:spore maturation protein SpmA